MLFHSESFCRVAQDRQTVQSTYKTFQQDTCLSILTRLRMYSINWKNCCKLTVWMAERVQVVQGPILCKIILGASTAQFSNCWVLKVMHLEMITKYGIFYPEAWSKDNKLTRNIAVCFAREANRMMHKASKYGATERISALLAPRLQKLHP